MPPRYECWRGAVEAVDIVKDGCVGLWVFLRAVVPNQLRFDGFNDCFDNDIVVTVSYVTHGWHEFVSFQSF